MDAIPTSAMRAGQAVISGLSCTDCSGVLTVHQEGDRGFLVFRCRVGHTYSVHELLAGKERRIEEHLWSAVATFEELEELLTELSARPKADRPAFLDRAQRARRAIEILRSIIAANDQIQFDHAIEE